MSIFSKRLKSLRLAKGLSIKDLAKEIQVPVTTYREWEYGREIKGEPYLRIAKALDVPLHQLLGGPLGEHKRLVSIVEELEFNLKRLKNELASFF